MARQVTVQVLDDKENTLEESLVRYQIASIPNEVIFFSKAGVIYAQWWNLNIPPNLITVPASQLIAIE